MGHDMLVERISVGWSHVGEGSTPTTTGRSVGVMVWRAPPTPAPVAAESAPAPVKPTRRTFARLPPAPPPAAKRGGNGKKVTAPPPAAKPKVVKVVKAPRDIEAQPTLAPVMPTSVEIAPAPAPVVAKPTPPVAAVAPPPPSAPRPSLPSVATPKVTTISLADELRNQPVSEQVIEELRAARLAREAAVRAVEASWDAHLAEIRAREEQQRDAYMARVAEEARRAVTPALPGDVASLIGVAGAPKAPTRRKEISSSRRGRSLRRASTVPLEVLQQISRPPSVLFPKTVTVVKEERSPRCTASAPKAPLEERVAQELARVIERPRQWVGESNVAFALRVRDYDADVEFRRVFQRVCALDKHVVARIHVDAVGVRHTWATKERLLEVALGDRATLTPEGNRKGTSILPFLLACERAQAKMMAARNKRR